MTLWHAYKVEGADTWKWKGTIETDAAFWGPPAQAIGEKFGTGKFLLTCEGSHRYEVKSIVQDSPVYIERDKSADEPPEPQSIRYDPEEVSA